MVQNVFGLCAGWESTTFLQSPFGLICPSGLGPGGGCVCVFLPSRPVRCPPKVWEARERWVGNAYTECPLSLGGIRISETVGASSRFGVYAQSFRFCFWPLGVGMYPGCGEKLSRRSLDACVVVFDFLPLCMVICNDRDEGGGTRGFRWRS